MRSEASEVPPTGRTRWCFLLSARSRTRTDTTKEHANRLSMICGLNWRALEGRRWSYGQRLPATTLHNAEMSGKPDRNWTCTRYPMLYRMGTTFTSLRRRMGTHAGRQTESGGCARWRALRICAATSARESPTVGIPCTKSFCAPCATNTPPTRTRRIVMPHACSLAVGCR